jgi:hypothetical protein
MGTNHTFLITGGHTWLVTLTTRPHPSAFNVAFLLSQEAGFIIGQTSGLCWPCVLPRRRSSTFLEGDDPDLSARGGELDGQQLERRMSGGKSHLGTRHDCEKVSGCRPLIRTFAAST